MEILQSVINLDMHCHEFRNAHPMTLQNSDSF